MTGGADPAAVEAAVAEAHRRGWATVLAATARSAKDLDLAEECVQEAYAAALVVWRSAGVPADPVAWLITTARRRAVDAIRRRQTLRAKLPLLIEPEEAVEAEPAAEPVDHPVADERLRLIFMCCHPALARDAQPALTLRLVCGMPAGEIARAFLVPEATMAARLTRAKKKIAVARIPFRTPDAAGLPDRLRGVLDVIYLLFTAGHTAAAGPSLVRAGLADEARRLARTMRELMPDEREVWGLLALLLVTDARRSTRTDGQGRLLRLDEQDRTRWDRAAIAEAHDLIVDGLRGGQPGRYVLQAAIAALHARAPSYEETDWPQILTLYDELLAIWPSPVVALNRLVAVAEVAGPQRALAGIEELEGDRRLARYHYRPAIKADLLQRLGRASEAAAAYEEALGLTRNQAERQFLTGRLSALGPAAQL
jgi:RNA polymerase sigma factor (sigma-70 family)